MVVRQFMTDAQNLMTMSIRYDGLDAEHHQLPLNSLAVSLQGLSRLLSVAGHFALTGKYAKQERGFDIRVMATGSPRANCLSIDTAFQFAQQYGLLQGFAGATLTVLIQWIIARNSGRNEEMKMLKDSLDKAIHEMAQGRKETVQALQQIIETIVQKERPALRKAVRPIGSACATLRIGGLAEIDATAAAIIRAFSQGLYINARAKAAIKDRNMVRLYISHGTDTE